jgi:hypothetical protein
MKKIREWLSENDDKIGKSGKPIKSNITDNESAKMKTSKGVIQGYDGVTVVDGKHQVIVYAEAFGQPQCGRFMSYVLRLVSRHLPTSGPLSVWIDLLRYGPGFA